MPATIHFLRAVTGALLLALLAACGGGGGGGDDGGGAANGATETPTASGATTASTDADLYVGRWFVCSLEQGGSRRETLDITRVSDTRASYSFVGELFASPDCTGAVQTSETGSGTVTLVGKGSIGGEVVDKVEITEGNETDKQIVAVRADGRLYVGRGTDAGGTLDAEGYPTSFDTDPYTRAG